jgi:hypothetical protein
MKSVMGICLFLFIALPVQAQYDAYGGWLELRGKKTGFFHTEKIEGVGGKLPGMAYTVILNLAAWFEYRDQPK